MTIETTFDTRLNSYNPKIELTPTLDPLDDLRDPVIMIYVKDDETHLSIFASPADLRDLRDTIISVLGEMGEDF